MSWLLDTCLVSELVKPKPATRVVAWIESCEERSLYLSVITIPPKMAGKYIRSAKVISFLTTTFDLPERDSIIIVSSVSLIC